MLTKTVDHRAFISGAVRNDFIHRIVRHDTINPGPVITLGADGLGIERQTFRSDRRSLVCIGSLEGKKLQEIAFRAFRDLPKRGFEILQFLGRVPLDLAPWLSEIVDYQGADVELVDSPSDETVRTYLRKARAAIFIGKSEGFGLPAVEALHAGIPVIVHADLPSLAHLPGEGQVRLSDITVESVAAAIARLNDDAFTENLWRGASTLKLPTWAEYGSALADWIVSV